MESTKSIIVRADSPLRYLSACLAGVMGIALCALAIPRLGAAFDLFPVLDSLNAVRVPGGVLPGSRIDRLTQALTDAANWTDNGRLWTDTALAEISRLDGANYSFAEEALHTGLQMAPANPYAWLRMSYVQYAQGKNAAAVAAARMSVFSGNYVPDLMRSRLGMLLALHGWMAPDDVAMVGQQIGLMWATRPEEVVAAAKDRGAILFVRSMFGGDLEALSRFDGLVARSNKILPESRRN